MSEQPRLFTLTDETILRDFLRDRKQMLLTCSALIGAVLIVMFVFAGLNALQVALVAALLDAQCWFGYFQLADRIDCGEFGDEEDIATLRRYLTAHMQVEVTAVD